MQGSVATSPKLLTLLIIVQGQGDSRRLLLGKKKRGFGAGYFNGFGGKVEKGETVKAGALRELEEEAGVRALDATHRGVLTFHFDDNPQPWEVHVYGATKFSGEPVESDEMAPQWFTVHDIPYENMWADDEHWYPLFLDEEHFKGEFHFTNTTTLLRFTLISLTAEQVAEMHAVRGLND